MKSGEFSLSEIYPVLNAGEELFPDFINVTLIVIIRFMLMILYVNRDNITNLFEEEFGWRKQIFPKMLLFCVGNVFNESFSFNRCLYFSTNP